MMVRHLPNLLKINTMFGQKPANLNVPVPPGVWLVGDAGCGKTTLCEQFVHYKKDPRHKWFDGYNKEKVVVVDDFAPFHVAQTDILKTLGHQFTMQGETKGGSIWLRPHAVIITSQYQLQSVWDKDAESLAAIERRYRVFGLPGQAAEASAYIKERLEAGLNSQSTIVSDGVQTEEESVHEETHVQA